MITLTYTELLVTILPLLVVIYYVVKLARLNANTDYQRIRTKEKLIDKKAFLVDHRLNRKVDEVEALMDKGRKMQEKLSEVNQSLVTSIVKMEKLIHSRDLLLSSALLEDTIEAITRGMILNLAPRGLIREMVSTIESATDSDSLTKALDKIKYRNTTFTEHDVPVFNGYVSETNALLGTLNKELDMLNKEHNVPKDLEELKDALEGIHEKIEAEMNQLNNHVRELSQKGK